MRSVLAGIGGALLATVAVTSYQTPSPAPSVEASTGAAPITAPATSDAQALPVALSCAPGQRAIVRPAHAVGATVTTAECIDDVAAVQRAAVSAPPASLDLVEMPRPRATPAIVAAPTPQVVSPREAKPERSWKKTAMIIGGSAGAGAGIGGLTGGKKGALIGAAIGGGAASIYEAVKR
jgi:hypothetical protein